MKAKAQDVDRIIQNVLLYVNPKSTRLTEVLLIAREGRLHAYATDDYVAITDSCEVTEVRPLRKPEFHLTIEDTKKLGEYIKLDKKVVHKSDIEFKFKNTLFTVSSNDSDTEENFTFLTEGSSNWSLVHKLLDHEAQPQMILINAYRPDRLAKLARIKADKEAPIDMRGIEINGKHLVQFKLGETVTGCIMPADRSYVDERFLWEY